MNAPAPAVHWTIVCVDVEKFTDRHRTHPDQLAVRDGLYRALHAAFARCGVSWQNCYIEDRGDGALVLVPAQVPKSLLTARVFGELAVALAAYNQAHERPARIRLRLAVHAGEVCHDAHGVVGTALSLAFRLLEAAPLKRALANSEDVLVVIASQWFYEEVIRHDPSSAPASYRRVRITVKETRTGAWVREAIGSRSSGEPLPAELPPSHQPQQWPLLRQLPPPARCSSAGKTPWLPWMRSWSSRTRARRW